MPSNVLPVSSLSLSSSLNSTTQNAISLLQGLMESWGWRDLHAEIYAAEIKQQSIEQQLKFSIQNYLEKPNKRYKNQLIAALEGIRESIQAEYDYALQQKADYQVQAEREIKEISSQSYLDQWKNWAFQGVKRFFGSTTDQLIEKYAEMASQRQAQGAQLSRCLESLRVDELEQELEEYGAENKLVHPGQQLLSISTPSLFPAIIPLANLNGINGFKLDGEASGDNSGCIKAAGDINGDGYDDLIIGASGHANGTGRSYVVFGSSGIGSGGLLALSSLNGTNGFKLDGETLGDGSGNAVSTAGDINGDGYTDLLIGAYMYANGTGRSYVVFGGPWVGSSGLLALSSLNGTNGFKIDGEALGDWSGHSFSKAGDINGDGHADLIIGTNDWTTGINRGYSYVVFGGPEVGKSGVLALSSLDGTNGFKLIGDTNAGSSVSGGEDINGDSYVDLLIGASDSPGNGTGQSYVVFGGSEVGKTGILVLSFNGTNGFTLIGEQAWDWNGNSVHITADVNGDGYADLITGAPGHASSTGRSYVVFGGPKVGGGSGSLALSNLNGANGFKLDGESSNDFSGASVSAAGDINMDGYDDLIIGAQWHASYAGRSYVVFGGPGVGSTGLLALSSLNGINGFKLDGEASNDQSGFSVSTAGDINGDGCDDVLIGAPYHGSNAGRSYVVLGDRSPQIWTNQLVIHSGESLVLTASNLNATGMVIPTFSISNIQHGHFELLFNPAQAITMFNQSQILNGQIRFVHDGSQSAPGYAVQATSRIAMSPLQAANITFYRQPAVLSNQLSINQGQSILFTTNQLTLTDDYPGDQVMVEIVNLQHGQFQLMPQNTSIAQFTQQQLIENQIIFVQDGTSNPPAYQVIISDPYFKLAPLDAQVTFYRQPAWINNRVSINQGQSLLITSDMLSVSDDYPQELVLFTVNNIQNAYFALTSGVTITQFSASQISGSQVKLIHDGSSIPPAYQITGQDPYFSLSANQAVVYFYRSPAWITNQLTITPGAIVLITLEQMNVTDDYSDDQVIFKASNLVGGQFESTDSSHIRLDQWTQQQIRSNQVQFHHNGADMAPNYLMTASDPYFLLPPSGPIITYPPQILNNQLALLQGRSSLLTASNLQATDVSPGITPQNLTFIISNVKYGQFTQVTSPSVAILSFTQAQINSGGIQFIQDGSRNVPAYIMLVSDGRFNSSQQAGKVTLNTEPQLINNRLDIKQGASVVLTIANLKAVDDVTPDANLVFTLTNVQHGYFALVIQPDQPLTIFSQAKIINAEMEFIHDGSPSSPTYAVTATDADGLSCSPQNAQISFTPSGGDALRIVNNQLQISQGRTVILSEENLSAVYENNPEAELAFTVSNIQHGQFSWVQAPTNKTTQFSQQQINNLEVQFTQDGSRITPAYDVIVSGNGMSTLPQAAKVFLNTAPLLLNNRLTLSPGQTVTLSTINVLATDDTTDDDQLQISIFNQSHGYFMMLETNHTILGFTQGDVDKLTVAFRHDGSLQAPAYSVMVTDSNGLSTEPQSAQITFNLPPDTQTSTSLRNTIIGAIVSGVASLGFLGLKIFINRRADQYFEKAAESEGVGGEQMEFHKNVIRPIAKCILEYVKITGFMGYVSNRTMQDAFVAIIVLIDALDKRGVDVDLLKLKATQRARFLHVVAREIRIQLVPEVGLCSCTRLVRFFTPEITPMQLEAEAENIAEAVKGKLGSYQPPSGIHDMKGIPSALPLSRSRLPLNIDRLDRKPETTSRCLLC